LASLPKRDCPPGFSPATCAIALRPSASAGEELRDAALSRHKNQRGQARQQQRHERIEPGENCKAVKAIGSNADKRMLADRDGVGVAGQQILHDRNHRERQELREKLAGLQTHHWALRSAARLTTPLRKFTIRHC